MERVPPFVEVVGVHKSFGQVHAVAGVDLTLGAGEFVALLGPNGAGKTTLAEMIEGILIPDRGQIRILGQTWAEGERELRQAIGLSLQETKFSDRVTVEETLCLFATLYGLPRSRALEVMAELGLEEKRKSYVMNLSGGQRQRLALGVAVVHRPKVLILDEPTTGLDPHARRDIWDILRRLKASGTTTLLTTHYMEEAEVLCERIVIMDHGRILAQGTLDDLLSRHGRGDVIAFTLVAGAGAGPLRDLPGLIRLEHDPVSGQGRLLVPDILTSLPLFQARVRGANLPLLRLECRRPNLDDLFVDMTGRRIEDEQ